MMKKSLALVVSFAASGIAIAKEPHSEEKQAEWDTKVRSAVSNIEAAVDPIQKRRVLVLSKTAGFYHSSIETAETTLREMAKQTGAFEVEFHDQPEFYTAENLKGFDVLVFNNTTYTQDYLNVEQRGAVLEFIAKGGGFVGIHAASDCGTSARRAKSEWPEVTEMIGGAFDGHPWTKDGTYSVKNEDPQHKLLDPLSGAGFEINDELYKFKDYKRGKLRVLLSIDLEKSYHKKCRADHDNPLVWIKSYGKGRVFYSTFGHNEVVYTMPKILQMWLNGIQFAAGDLKVETASLPMPESTKRFVPPVAKP